jgi:hypothetical protein
MSTKTEIDLQAFCDAASTRYAAPFVQGGWRYATDDRILVAVPALGEPDTTHNAKGEAIRTPKLGPIMEGFEQVEHWHPLPPRSECHECDLGGYVTCERCRGTGFHICPTCYHEGECGYCDDGQGACTCYSTFGDQHVATWLVQKMRTLPGVEWGSTGPQCIFFRFDGGRGRVMPLDKAAAREATR